MFETPFSVVGTVVTDPVARRVGEQDYVHFRVASNSRRRTPDGDWENGNTLYLSVNCWGKVAEGISSVLYKGDPVVVIGEIYTNEYDDKEGNHRSRVEVKAHAVGPDLSRCRAKLERTRRVEEPAARDDGSDDDVASVQPTEQELTLSA